MNRYRVPVEIRFKDVDWAGHVHHSVYLLFLEQARLKYFAEFVPEDHNWNELGMVVAHVEIDYLNRLGLNDSVIVELWCERIGSKSFDLAYNVIKNDNVNCCTVKTTMVCFDFEKGSSIDIPSEWRDKLQN